MANSCAIVKWNSAGTYPGSGNFDSLNSAAYGGGAGAAAINAGTPYYFNADAAGITCLSFPTAGDTTTIFGLNAQIVAQQAAISNLQSQVTAITAIATASSPAAEQRFADMAVVWGLFFGALIVVSVAVGIKKMFNSSPHEG